MSERETDIINEAIAIIVEINRHDDPIAHACWLLAKKGVTEYEHRAIVLWFKHENLENQSKKS